MYLQYKNNEKKKKKLEAQKNREYGMRKKYNKKTYLQTDFESLGSIH
jgi:hypothetical protein